MIVMDQAMRAELLRDALLDMAGRYGAAEWSYGAAIAGGASKHELDRFGRASTRRFKAIMRISAALRDLGVDS